MAVNIGPKIGIDGEKEYRKQLNDLITTQKTFSSELRELESDFNSNASAMDKNRKKGELLEKSIKNQEKQFHRRVGGGVPSGEDSPQTDFGGVGFIRVLRCFHRIPHEWFRPYGTRLRCGCVSKMRARFPTCFSGSQDTADPKECWR